MKHKVSELEGALLDAAVAKAEGLKCFVERSEHLKKDVCYANWAPGAPAGRPYSPYCPSSYWNIGGPIIEREGIESRRVVDPFCRVKGESYWLCGYDMYVESGHAYTDNTQDPPSISFDGACATGPTPLIAAMRAYVASKFGAEVELPDNA